MLKTEVTTIRATFVGLTDGEPPSVRLHKLLVRPDSGRKPLSMSVPVHDARLLTRLRSELNPGDLVEATVETRWGEAGIPKALIAFAASVRHDQELVAAG